MVAAGTDLAAAMAREAEALRAACGRASVIPVGGSSALGGLGDVACARELQRQVADQGLHFDRVVLGSDSAGTHGGRLAGFLGLGIATTVTGIGVSREPDTQGPLGHAEAQAVVDLWGAGFDVARAAVHGVGGCWQPGSSEPNAAMVEAGQLLARTEGVLLDPVYTGKVMAGLTGMARRGEVGARERGLLLHTGGLPVLCPYEDAVLGDVAPG